MTVVEQEVDAVLLGLNRIVDRTRPNHCEPGHADLESARRARFGAHFAGDVHRRLGRQLLETLPDLGRELRLHEHRLHDPRAVADHGERNLSRGPNVRDPAANGDGAVQRARSSAMRGVVSGMEKAG